MTSVIKRHAMRFRFLTLNSSLLVIGSFFRNELFCLKPTEEASEILMSRLKFEWSVSLFTLSLKRCTKPFLAAGANTKGIERVGCLRELYLTDCPKSGERDTASQID